MNYLALKTENCKISITTVINYSVLLKLYFIVLFLFKDMLTFFKNLYRSFLLGFRKGFYFTVLSVTKN